MNPGSRDGPQYGDCDITSKQLEILPVVQASLSNSGSPTSSFSSDIAHRLHRSAIIDSRAEVGR